MNLFSFLGAAFILLKVLGIAPVAEWSWWLVLLPIYGQLALAVLLLIYFNRR